MLSSVRASHEVMPDLRDRVWAERIRAGDVAAFEEVFRQLAAPLQVFAAGFVGSAAVAEELVQEIFLALWCQRESLEIRASILTYLYVAARNRAITHLKHEHVVAAWEAASPAVAEERAATVEDDLVEAELSLRVQEAIDRLPERTRQVFTLSRHQNMTYDQIAQALGVSVKTVETQMGRALRILRMHLRPLFE